MPKLKVDLIVDDKGTVKVARFGRETQKAMRLGSRSSMALNSSLTTMTGTLTKLGAIGAGLGLGAAVMAGLDKFGAFETALTDMSKVTSRDLGTIKAEIMSLPPELGNATELMRGYYQTISAGVTDPVKALEFLTGASKAAKAAHFGQGETIKGLSKIMAGFQGQVESVAQASDLMFAIEKEGQTNFAELVPIIGDISAASFQMSVSSHEMGAALAQITQTAGSTSQAATQYRGILMGLFKPQEKMTKLLSDLGYSSGQAMIQELGLAGALKKVRSEATRTGVPMGKLFESSEALIGLAALGARDFSGFENKLKAIGQSAGSTDRFFREWQGTFAATKDVFYATIGDLAIDFGKELAPGMKTGMEDFVGVVLDNKEELIDTFKNLGIAIQGTATAMAWLAKQGGSSASWASDLGTGLGAVAAGDLSIWDVAGANGHEGLHDLVSNLTPGQNKAKADLKQLQRQLKSTNRLKDYYDNNPAENFLGGLLHDQNPSEQLATKSQSLELQIQQAKGKVEYYQKLVDAAVASKVDKALEGAFSGLDPATGASSQTKNTDSKTTDSTPEPSLSAPPIYPSTYNQDAKDPLYKEIVAYPIDMMHIREKNLSDMETIAQGYRDRVLTPFERMEKDLVTLDLAESLLDPEIFVRNQEYLLEEYDSAMEHIDKKNADTTTEMSETWKSAYHNMESYTANTFYDMMTGNYDNIGSAFSDMLTRQVSEYASAQLQMALMGDGESGMGGLIGAAGSAIGEWLNTPTATAAETYGPMPSAPANWHAPMASYAVGTDYVPHDMIAQIHQGERIIPASQNKASNLQPEIHIHNNNGSQIEVKTSQTVNGRPRYDVLIDKAVEDSMHSGRGGRSLSAFGISPVLAGR